MAPAQNRALAAAAATTAADTTPRPRSVSVDIGTVPAGDSTGREAPAATDARSAAPTHPPASAEVPEKVMDQADRTIGKLVAMLGQSEEQVAPNLNLR